MTIDFDFNGNSFISGMLTATALFGFISVYWLIAVPFFLTTFQIKGMPYATLTYKTGEGWRFSKGRYT